MTSMTPLKVQAQLPKLPFSQKQIEFLRGSNRSYNVCEGSVRSGKTVITLFRWLLFIASAPEEGSLVMVGRTRESVWENMIGVMQNPEIFGEMASEVVGNRLSDSVVILGRRVRVMGASDIQAEMVIRGATVAGACVDEITTLPEGFFKQLCARMSVRGAQLFGTTNPDSPAHWFKTGFLDRINASEDPAIGWTRWHFKMDDNPYLSESFKAQQRAMYKGLFYQRFIEGLWVSGDGAVFDFWSLSEHVVDHADLPLMRRLYIMGVDGGLSNASAALFLGLGVDNKLYFVNEWAHEPKQGVASKSYHRQAGLLREFMKTPLLPKQPEMKPKYITVDSAATDFYLALKESGLRNFVQCKKDSVLEGVGVLSSLLDEGKLKVSSSCKGLIREIPSYTWDKKLSLIGIDKPNKGNDHHLDAARYALMSSQSLWYRDMNNNR